MSDSQLVEILNSHLANLEAEIENLKESRDFYQKQCFELKLNVASLVREIKKFTPKTL